MSQNNQSDHFGNLVGPVIGFASLGGGIGFFIEAYSSSQGWTKAIPLLRGEGVILSLFIALGIGVGVLVAWIGKRRKRAS